MKNEKETTNYVSHLWAALLGRTLKPSAAPEISKLRGDVVEAEEKITRMREEYAALEAEKNREVAEAGAAGLQRVFRKLAPPLAMLSALAQKTRAGDNVLAIDLAEGVASVERALKKNGMERIGEPGTKVPFDPACHARMSGGAAAEGESVTLRLPGYRLGDAVLHKAMVAVDEKPDQRV